MKQEYGANQIQVLEGLEAVRIKTWYVHWIYRTKRITPLSV